MTNQEKMELIDQYIKTAGGRQKLAASFNTPVRTQRDYKSVMRKLFLVDTLPPAQLALYDRDTQVTAYMMGEEGEGILSVSKGKKIHVPLFVIQSLQEIPITQIQERKYDLVDRTQKKGVAEINKKEDAKFIAVLDAAATGTVDYAVDNTDIDGTTIANNAVIAHAAPVDIDVLADSFGTVEEHDVPVDKILMNARDYADLRKLGREELDPETQKDLVRAGLLASLWGVQIIVSRIVPKGSVYITTDPEFLGRVPVAQELTVLSADNPAELSIGFSMFERLGICATNPLGIQKIAVTR